MPRNLKPEEQIISHDTGEIIHEAAFKHKKNLVCFV